MASILILEDDTNTLNSYNLKFSKEGFSVLSATTGDEALRHAREHKPDIILLDIMLPGAMNGFDVLESLKRDEELKHVPVVIITNLETEERVSREIGAVDYIIKANTSLDDIVKRVKEILSL